MAGNQVVTVKEADGVTNTDVEVLGMGRQAATASKSVALSNEDNTLLSRLPPLKGASTGSAVATDPAMPVTIRDANANVQAQAASVATAGAPVVGFDPYSQYETVAASQTAQVMGATGAQYDYLAGVLIIPAAAAAGAVSITDGNGSAITIFAGGGTVALPSLVPFMVPLGLYALASTTPGWKITTGVSVSAIGIGKFT